MPVKIKSFIPRKTADGFDYNYEIKAYLQPIRYWILVQTWNGDEKIATFLGNAHKKSLIPRTIEESDNIIYPDMVFDRVKLVIRGVIRELDTKMEFVW